MTTPPSTPATPGPATPVPPPTPPAPAPRALRRQARAATARSTVGDRWLAVIVGLVLLAAGALVALLSYGVFGSGRAARPLLDPMIVDVLRGAPDLARGVAIAAGVLLVVVGLAWAAGAVRPETRPDLVLAGDADTAIVISSTAVAEAVAEPAGAIPGVVRARARTVGTNEAPAVRLTLWLADDADVREVLARIDRQVLATARESLGIAALPVAVRLELEHTTTPRVS